MFIWRTDAEASILRPPDAKSQLIGKDPDPGEDRRQNEKRVAEDEMVEWHHQLNGRELEQTPGDKEGQGSLACFRPWVAKSQTPLSNRTEERERVFKELGEVSKDQVMASLLKSC